LSPRLATLLHLCASGFEFWEPQPPRNLKASIAMALAFTL
jgi:hypothetical protein